MDILLVDDHRETRASIADFLLELGHKVVERANGNEALETLYSHSFHLVLSDIKMPGISGIELLQRMRTIPKAQATDVVLITGYGDMDSAIEALRAGASDYLLKPINVEDLVKTTERVARLQGLRLAHEVRHLRLGESVKEAAEDKCQESSAVIDPFPGQPGISDLVVRSPAMQKVFEQAEALRGNRLIPVLIQGETGTGKEVVARYIHNNRGSSTTPFVAVNCARLTPGVSEGELFGYAPGIHHGTLGKGRKGKLDLAGEGTLFLDHVAEMPLPMQAKLLRVIEVHKFSRVGGLRDVTADVRTICATSADLDCMVAKGTFRGDLYYRLNVACISLPPLRERPEEILPLAKMFLTHYSELEGKRFQRISRDAATRLMAHDWPGNVRELQNLMERIVLMWDDRDVRLQHLEVIRETSSNSEDAGVLPVHLEELSLPQEGLPIEEFNSRIILKALEMNGGNKTATAKYLGISRRSLDCRLKKISETLR